MKMFEVKGKAMELGINPGRMNKMNLIRKIQEQEGNAACFREKNECDQGECCWREDCLIN